MFEKCTESVNTVIKYLSNSIMFNWLFSKLYIESQNDLALVLLNPYIPCLLNNVDPDQLASEEAS